jgi:hypothetical protein
MEALVTLSGHTSFFHPDVVFHHMLNANEIFFSDNVYNFTYKE